MPNIDQELIKRCKEGDENAYAELMHRYIRPIFNFIRQYIKNDEDANDVIQDVFFKVWKHMSRFQEKANFRPWIYAIARNTSLDYLKKKHSLSFSELNDDSNDIPFAETIPDTEPLLAEIFEQKESIELVVKALDNLKPDYRAVLSMHYQDQMTFDEIASVLNKPMNTVKSWHHRALLQLRSILENENAPKADN